MNEPEDHRVFNNSKASRNKALEVLKKAKELEAQQLKKGYKWKQYKKTAILEPPKLFGPTSIKPKKNTGI